MIDAPSPAPRRGLRQRMLDHILHPELSAEQVAWSFAVGLGIAWNPLLGTHTWLVLGLCVLFRRLHRPLMIGAMLINNPWTMVPMATVSAFLGNLLLGRGLNLDLASIYWSSIGWRSFATRAGFDAMLAMLRPILAPYLLGGFVMVALSIPLGYAFMRWLTLRLRKIHWKPIHLPHPHLPHLHLHHGPKAPAGEPAASDPDGGGKPPLG